MSDQPGQVLIIGEDEGLTRIEKNLREGAGYIVYRGRNVFDINRYRSSNLSLIIVKTSVRPGIQDLIQIMADVKEEYRKNHYLVQPKYVFYSEKRESLRELVIKAQMVGFTIAGDISKEDLHMFLPLLVRSIESKRNKPKTKRS